MHIPQRHRKHFGWETFRKTKNDNGDWRTYFNGFPARAAGIISLDRKKKSRDRYASQLENEAFFNNSLIDTETQALLYRAICALPSKERRVLELSFVEGMKNIEIAEKLGVSNSMVKKLKARWKIPWQRFWYYRDKVPIGVYSSPNGNFLCRVFF